LLKPLSFMLYFIFFCVGLIVSSLYILNVQNDKINIVKLVILGVGNWVVHYTIISAILLFFDRFMVKNAMVYSCILGLILLLFTVIKKRKILYELIEWDIKKYLLLMIILFAGLIIIALKSVPVAPLFDSGCYVSKAIQLLTDKATAQVVLKEYSISQDESIRSEILILQSNQVGIYPIEINDDEYVYEYHGLPTWPAVLALSAKMFGIDNICLILSILYVLTISSIYFVLENMEMTFLKIMSALIIFAFSPLTLYLYKLPLSEGLITFLFVFSLFLLTEKGDAIKVMAGISAVAFCVAHISIFMYFPIFYVCILFLHVKRRKKCYAIVNMIFSVALFLSNLYAMKVSYCYLRGNLGTRIDGLNTNDMLMIIMAMALTGFVFQVVVVFIVNRKNINLDKINKIDNKYIIVILKVILAVILMYTIYLGYKIGYTDKVPQGVGSWRFRELYVNMGVWSILRLNIVNISLAMGWITFPVLIISFFTKKKISVEYICVTAIWIYALAIYTFINIDTPINYSASRYFIIVLIPAAVISFACIMDSKKLVVICMIISIVVGAPFNLTLLKTKEYDGNMQFLCDMTEIIESGAYVMIDLNDDTFVSYNLITNLRELNGNYVFNYDSFDSVKEKCGTAPIYLVSTKQRKEDNLKLISQKSYSYVGELYSLDVIYPTDVGRTSQMVYVYQKL